MSDRHQVVCPSCAAVNRLPAAKPAEKAKCGVCHEPLFSGHPANANGAMFEKQIARSSVPVVVDVWAPWCGPCRAMAPAFEQTARELEPHMRLAKVDIDKAPDIAAQYGVQGVPTLVVYKNGKAADRQVGALPASQLRAWIERHIG